MDLEQLTKKYLSEGLIMQLATVSDNKPWVCSVYYVSNENLDVYWLSYESRRHSQNIAENNRVAITIPIKIDQPVVGVQAEGTAEIVKDSNEVENVMKQYATKYDAGHEFYDNFINGKNKHLMYKFVPENFVLFDEFNFPDHGRKEWSV